MEKSLPFLPEGTEIRQIFIGQAAPNFGYFVVTYLTGLTIGVIKYRVVAVTPDNIYVLESTKLAGGGQPKALAGTMPRHTQFGPPSSGRFFVRAVARLSRPQHLTFARTARVQA